MTETFQSLQSTMRQLQMFAPKSCDTFNRFNWKRSLILVYLTVFTTFLSLCVIPSQTFTEYSKTTFLTVSGMMSIMFISIFYCYIPTIFELIGDFQSGIEMRQDNPESKAIYQKSNESIEKCCSIIRLWSVIVTLNASMLTNLVLTAFAYFTTGFDGYDYNFPYPLWFPFVKNLYEYTFEFTIEYIGLYWILSVAAILLTFLIASGLMIMSIVKDLRTELVNLCAIDMSMENSMEIRNRFFKFIRLHVHAIQCTSKLVAIYRLIFTVCFIWALVAICVSLLCAQIELSKDVPDYVALCHVFLLAMFSFRFVFIYSEFGQRLSNQFELLYDDIYEYNWHLLPMNLQRTWHIVLMMAQQPVQFVGFGSIVHNRKTFQRIVNACFLFLLIFHAFS